MLLLKAILYLCLPTAFGCTLVMWITRKNPLPFLVCLALGYGLGTGLTSFWMLLLSYANLPLTPLSINIPLLIGLILCVFVLNQHRIKPDLSSVFFEKGFDPLRIALLFIISLMLYYIYWRAITIPILSWDTFATMGLKGKVFFFDQSIANLSNIPTFGYPFHIPLLQAWLSISLGVWDNHIVKLFFPVTCTFYLIIQYTFLRQFTNVRWSLLSLLLLLSSNFFIYHSTISYRDITMLYFNCTSVLLIILWHTKKAPSYLLLAAFFAGITSFVKMEGFGYLGIHTLLVCFLLWKDTTSHLKDKMNTLSRFILISFSFFAVFYLYKKFYILPYIPERIFNVNHFDLSHIHLTFSTELFMRIHVVLYRYAENFFISGNWCLTWPLFFISCSQWPRKKDSKEINALLLVLGISFLIYFSAYTLTQHYHWVSDKHQVLSRSILHSFPLVTILIVLLNFSEKKN